MRGLLAAIAATIAFAIPALAQDDHAPGLHIHDAYARAMGGMGASGAIFMTIHNNTDTDNRVVSASADVAERVELHTHKEDANGVMQMIEVKEGFPLPAGEMHALERGGDHIMLLGLTRDLNQGDTFPLTVGFEDGSTVTIDVTVDNTRKPGMGMQMQHNHDAQMNQGAGN